MDDIKDLLSKKRIEDIRAPNPQRKLKNRNTERGDWMVKFCDRLNPGRDRDGYEKLTPARMGRILQGIPTEDLYAFYRRCEDAKSFGKYFWWSLNPSKFNHAPDVQNS